MIPTQARFPALRLRRTRATPAVRALVRENALEVGDLIWPVFVRKGEGIEEPVPSMPGVMRREQRIAQALGIPRTPPTARYARSRRPCRRWR